MIEKWCKNTSLNGIIDLYESKDKKGHFIFWICVMVLMLSLTGFLIATNIMNFISSPTMTKVDTVFEKDLQIPEILLCYQGGLNVAKMKSFNLSDKLISVLQGGYFSDVPDVEEPSIEKEFTNFLEFQNISVKGFYEIISSHDCSDIIINRRIPGHIVSDANCLDVSIFLGEDTHSCLHLKNNGYQVSSNPIKGGLRMELSSPKGAKTENRDYLDFTNSFTMALDRAFHVQGDVYTEIPLGYRFTIFLSLTKYTRLRQKCFQKGSVKLQTGFCHKSSFYNPVMTSCNCTLPTVRNDPLEPFPDNICSVFQFRKVCSDKWSQVRFDGLQISRKCQMLCEELEFGTSLSFVPLEAKNISKIIIGYSHMQYTNVSTIMIALIIHQKSQK